jgi:hypothetical protein
MQRNVQFYKRVLTSSVYCTGTGRCLPVCHMVVVVAIEDTDVTTSVG